MQPGEFRPYLLIPENPPSFTPGDNWSWLTWSLKKTATAFSGFLECTQRHCTAAEDLRATTLSAGTHEPR